MTGRLRQKGFSLLEVLVVLAVFSLLAIISTTAVLLAVRGAQKSSTTGRVRENTDYTLATIERQIRNATEITTCNADTIIFKDQDSNQTSFSCINIGGVDSYVASGSAGLTATGISVTRCSFACSTAIGSGPPSVSFDITATDRNTSGPQGSTFTASTQIFLRTY